MKQAIAAEIEASRASALGGAGAAEAKLADPVPELTKAHFEEAMTFARRSNSDAEITRYEALALVIERTS